MHRDEQTEFIDLRTYSSSLPVDISKTVVAFANSEAGDIYIGVSQEGNIIGVQDTDAIIASIRSKLHKEIMPDVLPLIELTTLLVDRKEIIKLSIDAGFDKPYFLTSHGMTPDGVYMRDDHHSRNTTESEIREMLVHSTDLHWECRRCLNQDLTFKALDEALENAGIEKTESLYSDLKLIGSDGLYTNAALAVSDQCPHSTVIKVYELRDSSVSMISKVYKGSIINQYKEAFIFLDSQNKKREYAPDAIREALLNSILHRDYSKPINNMISRYPDRLEFLSPGALPGNLTIEDLFMGASVPVNPNIMKLFITLHLADMTGFGIRKMQILSNKNNTYASFHAAEDSFLAILHKRNDGRYPEDLTPITNQ